jgi:hypothetical protein
VLRLRDEASESYLKRTTWRGVAVMHFATHALVDDRVLARSVIALTPGEGQDGFLDPGELAALHLDAELVVLSGCRTAGGVVLVGEGLQGLTEPLLEAGVRAVVASNWALGDRTTLPFVDRFYAGIARGMTAGDALRQARVGRDSQRCRIDQWSAFTLVGDAGASSFGHQDSARSSGCGISGNPYVGTRRASRSTDAQPCRGLDRPAGRPIRLDPPPVLAIRPEPNAVGEGQRVVSRVRPL